MLEIHDTKVKKNEFQESYSKKWNHDFLFMLWKMKFLYLAPSIFELFLYK